MKVRFKSFELLALISSFLVAGFTIGYLYSHIFSLGFNPLDSEKMILIGAFGTLLPVLFGMYLISRGVVGHTIASTTSSSSRRKRFA